MHTTQQNPNTKKCVEILARNTREAMVRDKYASGTEEAKNGALLRTLGRTSNFKKQIGTPL